MKSIRTQIIEAIVSDLWKIKKGRTVPMTPTGSTAAFSTTVGSVNRALMAIEDPAKFPALFVTDPVTDYRHIIQDIRMAKMSLFISGALQLYNSSGQSLYNNEAIPILDALHDDVQMVLMANSTWNGLARRSRILSSDASTEVEEPSAAFAIRYETDFIDLMDIALDIDLPDPWPIDPIPTGNPLQAPPQYSYQYNIAAAVFNVLLTIPGIAWVQQADVWPIPPEQILRKQCPGVWFQNIEEQFKYTASFQADKILTMQLLHVAVDTNPATYEESVDSAIVNIKNVIGQYADLNGRILTWDLNSIRANRSEFPVIFVDTDTTIRVITSFLTN